MTTVDNDGSDNSFYQKGDFHFVDVPNGGAGSVSSK
jgi:hypothetical protein